MKTAVISFRIPKSLKKEMEKVPINWGEELINFIEKRIREERLKKALESGKELLRNIPVATTPSWKFIREERNRR